MPEHKTREDWDTTFRIYSQERAINYSWYDYNCLLEENKKLIEKLEKVKTAIDYDREEEMCSLKREVERLRNDKERLHSQLNYWRNVGKNQ